MRKKLIIYILFCGLFILTYNLFGQEVLSTPIKNSIEDIKSDIIFKHFKSFDNNGLGTIVTFSPNEKYLAVGGGNGPNNGEINIYEIKTGTKIETFALTGYTRSIAFSPDGNLIAVGSDQIGLTIYDSKSGSKLKSISCISNGGYVSFSLDGRYLGIATMYEIYIFETHGFQQVFFMDKINGMIKSFTFSPDSRTFAVSTSKGSYIYDMISGAVLKTLNEKYSDHNRSDMTSTYNNIGDYLLIGTLYDGVVLCNLANNSIMNIYTGFVNSVDFSPFGKYIVLGASDRGASVYELNNFQVVNSFSQEGISVYDVSFSPLGNYLALSGDGKAILYQIGK